MIKPNSYNGEDLSGEWLFTRKLDGVRMLRDVSGHPVSRAGKPLYNLQDVPQSVTDAEVYLGDWSRSVSAVRTKAASAIKLCDIYSLSPLCDDLLIGRMSNVDLSLINSHLLEQLQLGNEGLVIYGPNNKCFKFKDSHTIDLRILDIIEGKGKRKGCVGKVVTSKGNVGVFSGYNYEQLKDIWRDREKIIGSVGEFVYMNLTDKGKMRNPKMTKLRFDKDTTDD